MGKPSRRQLERAIRLLAQRSTHTWRLPGSGWARDEIVRLLCDHGLRVTDGETAHNRIRATHRFGREYTLTQDVGGIWRYATTYDPIGGLEEIRREQRSAARDLFGATSSTAEDGAPQYVWWDEARLLEGRFISFDLETTPKVDGEFPEIVLGSIGDETGEAYLITKEQIVPWFVAQFRANPNAILCNWNLAGFDLCTCIYRVPEFRERVFDAILEPRIHQGLVYDTEIFVKLRDIARTGYLLTPGGNGLGDWQMGWGKTVYGLGPQAARFLGIVVPKEERMLFWRYLGRPGDITEEMAGYALNDAVVTAALQKLLYHDSFVWEVAASARAEIGRLNGRTLERRDGWVYDELLEAANLQFGWQTHTIQFLSAISLSWNSIVGVEVNVDHAFRVIEELEDELAALRERFKGTPCRPVFRVKKDGREQVGWVPEGNDPNRVIARIKSFHDEWADATFEVDEPETFQISYVNDAGVKVQYRFVSDHYSISEKAIREYVLRNLGELKSKVAKGQKLDEQEINRVGLQGKPWAIKFGVDEPEDVPDPVLQTKFKIAALQKRIATVKTYLPGVAANPERDKLTSMHSLKLRRHVDAFVANDPYRGRFVFPTIKALGAASARTAGGDPNTQQVERSDRMRNIFIAPIGYDLIVCDYGAAEMVTQAEIYAHRYPTIPPERRLVFILNEGYDPHLLTGMKVRYPAREAVWRPVMDDEGIRNLKRAVDDEAKRAAIRALRQRPHPLMQALNENAKQTGEDLAKDLWIDLLAETMFLDSPTGPAMRAEYDEAGWAAIWKQVGDRELRDDEAPPAVGALRKYRKDVKSGRQAAKPINFGVPGGMKPARIVASAKTDYKVDMTLAEAEAAFEAWMVMIPEGVCWLEDGRQNHYRVDEPAFPFMPYYDHCWTLTGRLRGRLRQPDRFDDPRTDHLSREEWLAQVPYDPGNNEWHNTQFQGLAADGAKLGDWYVWRQGIEKWNFVHDEIGALAPERVAADVQTITIQEMRRGMMRVLRFADITVGGGPMKKWCK